MRITVTATAETASEITVAQATPATFMWKPATNTTFRMMFSTPAIIKTIMGLWVSPAARRMEVQ